MTSPHPNASPPPTPTIRALLEETAPLALVVPVAGPPIVFLAGPWLLLILMMVGYGALLATVVALVVTALAVIRLVHVLLAAPFRLARRVRLAGWSVHVPAARLVVGASR
jgi:hypothetical protein